MKILVIGASGYIGSHVAAVVADAGHGVSALHRPGVAPPPARYSRVAGDLGEPGSLTAAAAGYDRVIHAGGLGNVGKRAIAVVVEQRIACALQSARSAIDIDTAIFAE